MAATENRVSRHRDIAAPGHHPFPGSGRSRIAVLMLPLALLVVWAIAAPLLRDHAEPPLALQGHAVDRSH